MKERAKQLAKDIAETIRQFEASSGLTVKHLALKETIGFVDVEVGVLVKARSVESFTLELRPAPADGAKESEL